MEELKRMASLVDVAGMTV